MIMSGATTTTTGPGGGAVGFIVVAALCVYFFPSIVAILRRVNIGQVIVINLFLGWTLIGWVSALVMSCATKIYIDPPQVNHYYQAPALPLAGPPAGWYEAPSGSGQRVLRRTCMVQLEPTTRTRKASREDLRPALFIHRNADHEPSHRNADDPQDFGEIVPK